MAIEKLIGAHPKAPHPYALHFSTQDGATNHKLAHRQLLDTNLDSNSFAKETANWVVTHHASDDMVEGDRIRREALKRQGLSDPAKSRFPNNDTTRKGNWTEIVLAEYIQASGNLSLPVYRLRYNPNVDQSMKGDDVLAFDLDSDPVRVLVGEAKFRGKPSKAAVEEMVSGLEKSHTGNIPASLQFVADRLFETGSEELGAKVVKCNELFALGKLSLIYVGLLVSNSDAHRYVASNGKSHLRRLAVISLGCTDPGQLVSDAFDYAQELIK